MQTPFYDAIAPLAERPVRFFVPGHKGNPAALGALGAAARWDLTEIAGADDLANPRGPLAESQRNMGRVYGSGATLYSASGSTSCIQAMFALFLRPGQKVAVARNCHISALRGLVFTDAEPVWMLPEAGRIAPEALARTLAGGGIDAVYVTSPDYSGRCCDIAALAKICRENGAVLLVDNAHGAHLRFVAPPKAPAGGRADFADLHPLTQGADAVAESAHKTLPCLTPAALLHLRQAALAGQARQALNLFSSTSPSYPVLLSLDLAAGLLLAEQEAPGTTDARFARAAERLAHAAAAAPHLAEPCDDPLKLCLLPAAGGWPAADVLRGLEAGGIVPEYADNTRIVLMASPWNAEEDFVQLGRVLAQFKQRNALEYRDDVWNMPDAVCGLRKAVLGPRQRLPLAAAEGRILASLAVPCPPGMPIALPGERLTPPLLALYAESGIFELDVVK